MSIVQTNRIQHSTGTGNNIVLSADGDTQINSLNTSTLAGFRNQIINPTGAIQQRSGGAGNSNEFGPDRWRMFTIDGGTVGAMSRQNVDTANVLAGVPPHYIAVGRNPGNSGAGFVMAQGIEDWTRFMGKTYTLSWIDGSDAGFTSFVQVLFSSNGTSGGGGNEFGAVGSSAANFVNEGTVGGWTRYSVTLNIPTLSTADYNTMVASSNACLLLKFVSNTGIAESNYGRYTAIQLEPGSVSTPLELRTLGTEFALCQRYYQQHFILGKSLCMHNSDGANDAYTDLPLPVPMRVFGPTAGPDFKIGNAVNTVGANSGLKGVQYANSACARLNMTKLGTASGGPNYLSLIGSGQDYFYLDAEL